MQDNPRTWSDLKRRMLEKTKVAMEKSLNRDPVAAVDASMAYYDMIIDMLGEAHTEEEIRDACMVIKGMCWHVMTDEGRTRSLERRRKRR